MEKCCVKKCVLSSFLNMAGLAAARISGGSEFHAAGPACEKARSANLVGSRGVTYLLLEADRRPVRVAALSLRGRITAGKMSWEDVRWREGEGEIPTPTSALMCLTSSVSCWSLTDGCYLTLVFSLSLQSIDHCCSIST